MNEQEKLMNQKRAERKMAERWPKYKPVFKDEVDPYEQAGIDALNQIRAGAFMFEQKLRLERIKKATEEIKKQKEQQ